MQIKIKIWAFYALFTPLSFQPHSHATLIMLNPAGDSTNRGRSLNASYERGTTFNWAQKLKQELEKVKNVEVIISHKPSEKLELLQIAQFSNQLSVDIFISLHMYAEQLPKPQISLFHLVRDPFLDFSTRTFNPLDIIPLYKSHLKNLKLTQIMATKMAGTFNSYNNILKCKGVFGIPLAVHAGILAPAIAIEAGICQDEVWCHKELIQPCVQAIITALEEISKNSFC